MERADAEAILDGDRETAVALLLGVGELIEANERLEARVAELERRLKRSSRNSSLPPSQDPLSAPPRPAGRAPDGCAAARSRRQTSTTASSDRWTSSSSIGLGGVAGARTGSMGRT
jgi:hypothetical protein